MDSHENKMLHLKGIILPIDVDIFVFILNDAQFWNSLFILLIIWKKICSVSTVYHVTERCNTQTIFSVTSLQAILLCCFSYYVFNPSHQVVNTVLHSSVLSDAHHSLHGHNSCTHSLWRQLGAFAIFLLPLIIISLIQYPFYTIYPISGLHYSFMCGCCAHCLFLTLSYFSPARFPLSALLSYKHIHKGHTHSNTHTNTHTHAYIHARSLTHWLK